MSLPTNKLKIENGKLKFNFLLFRNFQLSILRSKTHPLNSQLKKGFSLIELLTVIAIMGILTTMITASFFTAQKKARDSKRKSDLKAVQQALELYFQANGKYPPSRTGLIACDATPTTGIAWGNSFTCSSTVFINNLPKDPKNIAPNIYCYSSAAPSLTYTLNANLENTNDSEITSPVVSCNSTNYNYSTVNP